MGYNIINIIHIKAYIGIDGGKGAKVAMILTYKMMWWYGYTARDCSRFKFAFACSMQNIGSYRLKLVISFYDQGQSCSAVCYWH